MQLLRDDSGLWVDCLYDGRGEEGEPLHRDIVEEEDKGRSEGDGAEDAAEHLCRVELVEDFGGRETLRLYARNGQVLFGFRQPARCRGPVGQGEEGDERDADSDDALNGEEHAPLV